MRELNGDTLETRSSSMGLCHMTLKHYIQCQEKCKMTSLLQTAVLTGSVCFLNPLLFNFCRCFYTENPE